jgi:hypothetical protein
MSRVEQIEAQIQDLSPDELEALRAWFALYDAEVWDRQFEADVNSGALKKIADRALRDSAEGRATDL